MLNAIRYFFACSTLAALSAIASVTASAQAPAPAPPAPMMPKLARGAVSDRPSQLC
jgi:hypothetical protein